VFPSTANAPGIEGRTTGLCKLLVDQHPLNDRVPWGRCRRPAQVAAVVIAAEMTAEQLWTTTMNPATRTLLKVTAEDLVRFGMALMSGKLVKPKTLEQMWTPTGLPQLENGQASTYGLGFGIVTVNGQKVVSHSGGQQGTTTQLVMIPGKSFAAAAMANDDQAAPWDVTNAIIDFYRMPRQR